MKMTRNTDKVEDVICLKTKSILHVDWGNFEVEEGKSYKRLVEKDNSSDYSYIRFVWCYMPFPKEDFVTLSEMRDKKITGLGI
jgi:hypothetical protein